MTKRIRILNTNIDVLTMDETVCAVHEYIKKGQFLHLMGVNADKINLLNRDEHLREIVNSCGIINADGISVIKASRYLKKPLPERVAGIDLMQRLTALAGREHYRVYLLGARQEVVEKTAAVLQQANPGLIIAGIHNGYFTKEQWPEIAAELRQADPQIVFVGITSPQKEFLVEYLEEAGLPYVFMGVGGSFDVISGAIPRAPLWMQKCGMEWLFRVMQEPRRLWKRYLFGNLKFIRAVIQEKKRKEQGGRK